ncbi:GroES-like protein [Lentilactobacillus parafarraginis F0439]|uniref:GroES-like protein n=1 Tax=Lentilactobacillus parafarraginis F0439 TaxID=797515 RepID=G9ZPE6_9LACO|nr:GroES-like protein [Lentilactobacillus parafarraginis F0439]
MPELKALYFNEFGDSSVLKYGAVPTPTITKDKLLIKTSYIGLNFADIYRRRGDYHLEKHTPYINGYEAAGIIEKVGGTDSSWQIGEAILFVDVPLANAEYIAIPKENAIRLPQGISLKSAATIGLQGLTADFLAHDLAQNKPGDKAFIHGISGGVGQILSQILTADGVQVYGSTSTQEKQQIALNEGAKDVFIRHPHWDDKLASKFTTVFDGVGRTLPLSLKLASRRGKVVFFGMAGGNPPKIDLLAVLGKSQTIATGDLWDYLTSFDERKKRSQRLFDYFLNGKIHLSSPTTFKLSEGSQAHELLESGKSSGKILLVP